MPHRERYLFVCTNRRPDDHPKGSCAQKGSEEIANKLKAALFARGAAKRVRACTSGCLDLCELGVSIVQEPDHVAYGRVTLDDVEAIVDAVTSGGVVERLIVHPTERAPGARASGERATAEERDRASSKDAAGEPGASKGTKD